MTSLITEIGAPLLAALAARGFTPVHVRTGAEACKAIMERLPDGGLVAHGGSTTVIQIGLASALQQATRLRYANAIWRAEDDAQKRMLLRRDLSLSADVFMGSVQAVTLAGEVVGADFLGNRQAPYIFGPEKVIWIVGANKIVPDLSAALKRLREVALPAEDARVKSTGGAGSTINKTVIYSGDEPAGRTTVVLVDEYLGF